MNIFNKYQHLAERDLEFEIDNKVYKTFIMYEDLKEDTNFIDCFDENGNLVYIEIEKIDESI